PGAAPSRLQARHRAATGAGQPAAAEPADLSGRRFRRLIAAPRGAAVSRCPTHCGVGRGAVVSATHVRDAVPARLRRELDRHLAIDHKVDQILGLVLLDRAAEEPELPRRLLAALAEVALVEGEPQLTVFEHEILARAVVAAPVHTASASYVGILLGRRT